MTIVIICDYGFIKGGDSKVAILSALALKQQGYDIIYFTGVSPIDPRLHASGVDVICTEQYDILSNPSRFKASIQGIWNVKALKALKKLLDNLDPYNTIIHIHSVVKSVSPSIYKLIFDNNFKVVTTLHDYFLACPNGSFFNYGTNIICNIKPLSFQCFSENCDSRSYSHKLWRYFRTVIQKKYYKIPQRINYFISISDLSEQVLKKYLPAKASIFRLDNPIDIAKKPKINIKNDSNFAYIGRISAEKGIKLYLETAKHIKNKLLVIGDGPLLQSLRASYPSAIFTGWKNSNELDSYLKNIRAVIYPSLWYEVQPLVVLESLARGLPVVVPDTSATRELIIDGVTGLLFKGGDRKDLLIKMLKLEDTEFAKELGSNAYDYYWKNPFSINRHVTSLTAIYKTIIDN